MLITERTVDLPWFTRVDWAGAVPTVVFSVPAVKRNPRVEAVLQQRVARAKTRGRATKSITLLQMQADGRRSNDGFQPHHWQQMRAAVLATFPEYKVDTFTRDPKGTLRFKLKLKITPVPAVAGPKTRLDGTLAQGGG